jgi:hypothetical protein
VTKVNGDKKGLRITAQAFLRCAMFAAWVIKKSDKSPRQTSAN